MQSDGVVKRCVCESVSEQTNREISIPYSIAAIVAICVKKTHTPKNTRDIFIALEAVTIDGKI